MTALYRARLAVVAAILFACVVLSLEVPFSSLIHEHNEIAGAASALSAQQKKNRALRADIKALKDTSTIGVIAHEDYGLVNPGEQSVVVLPSAGESGLNGLSSGVLGPAEIDTSGPNAASSTTAPSGSGFFAQVLSHLEFWRSL